MCIHRTHPSVSDSVRSLPGTFLIVAAGRRTVHVVPPPGSLTMAIAPPSIRQKRWLIARPSPLPPYFRSHDGECVGVPHHKWTHRLFDLLHQIGDTETRQVELHLVRLNFVEIKDST